MPKYVQKDGYMVAGIFALSSLAISLLFFWQGSMGFNLWDEGFLWYGAQRVMVGDIPIRDFMAYDPGRYFWSAALMGVIGDNGVMSLRVAVGIFQAVGLFAGVLLIAQCAREHGKNSLIFLIVSVATLVVWMYPRHKLFDISLSIFLIGTLSFLVQNPVPRRYFIAGMCVGLVAVFGRNHGAYGVAGSLGVMLWLNIKLAGGDFLKCLSLWAVGVAIGFAPVIFMVLLVPAFSEAFWESIRFLFEQKSTNLPLPVPWPWDVKFSLLSFGDAVRGVLLGLFFLGTAVFGPVAILWVVLQRLREKKVPPAFVAASFLALPYAHFAFSRPDVGHLAQGIFPLLVGCLVVLSTSEGRTKWPFAIALCAGSLWVMHVVHPGWQCRPSSQCVNVEISGSNLQVDPATANDIALLRQLADQYAPHGQSFIATPFWPGAYSLLDRQSPVWEIYMLFPRSERFEEKEIERINASRPGFAFIVDLPLDGRDELRFRNTHPLTYQYILDNFEPVPYSPNPAYQIYKTRRAGQ